MSPNDHKLIIFLTENRALSDTVKKCLDNLEYAKLLSVCETTQELSSVLGSGRAVLVLTDEALGEPTVTKAISMMKSVDPDLPLVLITDKKRQDQAAQYLENGADDYVTTDNLKRLAPVLRREIKAYNEITAGRKARREIKELMNIIDSAEDEIYILGGDSLKIKFANKKALINLGFPMTELYGMHMSSIAEDIPAVTDEKSPPRTTFRTRFKRKDKTSYMAEAVFQSAETEGNAAILCIVHDITEKELAIKHAYVLDKAIDASASAVTVVDEKFRVIYTNKMQCQTAGMERTEMHGSSIMDNPMYANSGMEFFNAMNRCRYGQNWVGEYQKTAHDGEERIVLGSVSPVLADGINITNLIIVEEDITERVRIKSQLLHAQKMETVGELTSGIAHDFTNMLTAIGGFASIMKRKMDKESRFYTYVEKISELTVRAKGLTQNLLTFSRKQIQSERVVNVNTLVTSVGEFLSMVIGSRIELNIELMDEEVNIIGDPVQLEQVIINLATNARDAIENDGVLTISTEKTMLSDENAAGGFRDYAVIRVRDNGCGIEKSKLEKIFEPFFTTKQEGKGTGLGLYIVTDIVERHCGKIECISAEGEGTEFTIKIPATDQAAERACEEAEAEENPEENICLLIVEDEKIVRESLVHALDVYGFDIIEAVNGKEALDIYRQKSSQIDVVVTDIVMPVMNGITAYKEMIRIKPDQKVIFTTGYVGEAHRKEGFKEEDHVVMIKPLLIKELVKNIEKIMKDQVPK